jgi:hypothetical protein
VKYAGACEIACGSEIRLRRVEERISFHILLNKVKQDISQFPKEIISHSPSGEYFTSSPLVPAAIGLTLITPMGEYPGGLSTPYLS